MTDARVVGCLVVYLLDVLVLPFSKDAVFLFLPVLSNFYEYIDSTIELEIGFDYSTLIIVKPVSDDFDEENSNE